MSVDRIKIITYYTYNYYVICDYTSVHETNESEETKFV